jgi:GrpB-like predicted nucleotidyltransferase (UPF0157 family)
MPQHIVVTEYSGAWPALFELEAGQIRHILKENCVEIHHIGSTSVPGLKAKPIIDILPVVEDLKQVDAVARAFEQIGYEYLGEFGMPQRRYLRKGGDERTHQVHIFEKANQADVERHLAVRDYLRTHREAAEAYGRLKERLARAHPYDIDGYCAGKEAFMKQLEQTALLWKRTRDEA